MSKAEIIASDSREGAETFLKQEGWFLLGPKPEEGYRGYQRPDEVMNPIVGRPIVLREGWQDQDPERLLIKLNDLLEALMHRGNEVNPRVYDYWYRVSNDPNHTNLVFFKDDGEVKLLQPK